MKKEIKALVLAFFVLLALISGAQQRKPDFYGTWLLNVARSGPEQEIWLLKECTKGMAAVVL